MFGLKDKEIEAIVEVFNAFPALEKVVLFGSRARHTYRNGSDIDFAVYGSGLDHKSIREIEENLDELLLPYKMDVLLYKEINSNALKNRIDEEGVIFYERTTVQA